MQQYHIYTIYIYTVLLLPTYREPSLHAAVLQTRPGSLEPTDRSTTCIGQNKARRHGAQHTAVLHILAHTRPGALEPTCSSTTYNGKHKARRPGAYMQQYYIYWPTQFQAPFSLHATVLHILAQTRPGALEPTCNTTTYIGPNKARRPGAYMQQAHATYVKH